MRWESDGLDWPNREASRFVAAGPHVWHVQRAGRGPTVLLLHGAGGASHSWRDVFPLLAREHDVIAVDLPGQGFTRLGTRARCGLEAMAEDIAGLLKALGAAPRLIAGHSAGAAIALRLALDLQPAPRAYLSLNGAFEPFRGVAGFLFPMTAKLLAMNPFAGLTLSRFAASPASVRAILSGAGSKIDDRGVALYHRLLSDPAHVDATIAMMARWELAPVLRDAAKLKTPALMVAGARDSVVPPSVTKEFAATLPDAEIVIAPGFGHLHHEEDPRAVAAMIRERARR